MLKKYFTIMLTCSLITGSLKTEEIQQSYLRQIWKIFTKKMHTIACHGNENYMAMCSVFSLISITTGLKTWLSADDVIAAHVLLDNNGNIIDNTDMLRAWLQNVAKNKEEIVGVMFNQNFTKADWVTNTGEFFTYEVATKVDTFSESAEYKVMLGVVGITGLLALYATYKLLTTPEKPFETRQEN